MKAEFIVKTDDDQYVDLYEALVVVRRYSRSEEYVKNRFILCPVQRSLPILVRMSECQLNYPCRQRDPTNRWFVSYDEIPLEDKSKPGDQFYPTDCTGWIYITNPGTAAALARLL